MSTRIAPSTTLEAASEELPAEGMGDGERLAEIGRLGARLVLQRAVEEEVTAFLGRAQYDRTPQIRGAAARFVSSVIPNGRTALRTRPLEALIIGGWVRGLSDRDIESLAREAALGQTSKSTVCERRRARPPAWPTTCRRSACTSSVRCASAGASARRTCWSGRWRR